MPSFAEIKQAIDDMSEATQAFQTKHNERLDEIKTGQDDLLNRVEELETDRDVKKLGGKKPPDGAKVFYTSNGEKIFLLDHKTHLEDVLPPAAEPEVSLDRWLGAIMAGDKCQDKEALQFALEKKQMVTTTTGILIPEEFQSRWIDLIRSQMVLNAAGMSTVTMQAKTQTHSAVATDPATSWHAEAGSIDVGNPTFESRQLVAKTLVVRCQGSLEVSQDSPDFGAQLMGVMTRAMAQEVDRVGLIGSGVGVEPQGLRGHPSVPQQITGSPEGDYDVLLTAVRTLLEANLTLEQATRTMIMAPDVWAFFEGLATGISGDKTQLPRPRFLRDTAFRPTSALTSTGSPATTSPVFLGDFPELLLGVRREASVEALRLQTYATNLLLEFVGYMRLDFLVRRGASFVVLEGFQSTP